MSMNELAENVCISNVNLSNLKTGKAKASRFSHMQSTRLSVWGCSGAQQR